MTTHSDATGTGGLVDSAPQAGDAPKGGISVRLRWTVCLPAAWLVIVIVAAVSASWLPIHDPLEMDFAIQAAPPSALHWFGTDDLGRDMLSRAIHGARISLTVGFFAPMIALLLGTTLGMTSGYFRGRWETAVLVYADTSLAFPGIILLLLIVTYLGASLFNLTLALGILLVPAYTRIARANTLSFAKRDFVLASLALGAGHVHILTRAILPNVMLPVLAYTFIIVALVIVLEGVLSFLGLGVPHPTPSWGAMINDGRELLREAPHVSLIPAIVMFLTVLSFNLMGDTLRKWADTRETKV